MTRYPLSLRLIHWIIALMFIPQLAGGWFWLRTMSSDDPTKLDALMYHMAIGMGLSALMLVRLALRARSELPPVDGPALWVHRGFYAVVLLMPVTGMWMALAGRLNHIVFARDEVGLPADMSTIPGHFAHGCVAAALTALIVVHLVGVVKSPASLRRMR